MSQYEEFEGHVYLDVTNATVAWNVSRGCYCSANIIMANAEFGENCMPLSFAAKSHFGNTNRLAAEFAIEQVRRREFPEAVSRLMGIFVFGSVEDARAVRDAEGWPSHVKNENLTDCGVQACRKSRVDANWIPLIFDQNDNLTDDSIGFVRRYWQGEEAPGKLPVWETLVSGCLTLWGTDVKDRALSELRQYFSGSQHAWNYSEICFDVGSFDGTFVPVAVPDRQNLTIEDRFIIEDFDRQSFRDELRQGKLGMSGKLRRFGDFDSIKWPKLDLSQIQISLSELQKALHTANVGVSL